MRGFATLMMLGLLASLAAAQQTTDPEYDVPENTPQENARGGAVAQRAPGTWINAARQRHTDFINARVNAPRGGEAAGTLNGITPGGTGTGDSSTGGLTDLIDLLGSFGGFSGGLGDLLGGTGGNTTGGLSGGTTGTDAASLEELIKQMIADAGGAKSSNTASLLDGDAAAAEDLEFYQGANLPKVQTRAQSNGATPTTEEERSFGQRFTERMARTFFSALTVGFQSQAFITFLKDQLRPFLFPTDDGDDGSNQNTNSANVNQNSANVNSNKNVNSII